jgi:uncharacterized DUF497 family protein
MIQADTRYSYGEDRYRSARSTGRLFVLVYTPRQGAMRIISARQVNLREHRHYENHPHEHRS